MFAHVAFVQFGRVSQDCKGCDCNCVVPAEGA